VFGIALEIIWQAVGAHKFHSLSRLVCPVSKVNTHYRHAGVSTERERGE